MPNLKRRAVLLALWLGLGSAATAQSTRDQGDWPCRQIRVPGLAIASVWTGPDIGEAAKTWRDDAELSDLVARLAARRTPIEAAEKLVAEFAKAAGDKRKERLTALFAGVFARLDAERGEVIAGLDRYGRTQKDMAEKTRVKTQELRAQQDKGADAAKLAELSEALQWDLRLFEERRKAVAFVCETPALIEQRLGALARAILSRMY
jgi:hypothetical protein